ncbi:MAG TPA: AAA family ATPase [Solirubrobacterales bacterium]|jgi:tetratricopeptide (TPR) repeat protein
MSRHLRVPIQPIDWIDPTHVGIDSAAPGTLGDDPIPAYLPREVDAELREAVYRAVTGYEPWIVVAVGGSKVGKSRSLFEALRVVAPQAVLIAPVDGSALHELLSSSRIEEIGAGAILWLDDLEPFLAQGVSLQTLRRWREATNGIVAATYGGKGSDLVRDSASSSLVTIAADVLDHAREIRITATMPQELGRLRSELPTDAVSSIETHGLGAYLVAAPVLLRTLATARHAPGEPECPEGIAVAYTAIDWVRCGRRDPIPESTLRDLWPSYLKAELRATDGGFQKGLDWALQGVAGTIALLLKTGKGYRPYDYLVQFVDENPGSGSPHEATWAKAIDGATDSQALEVGTNAYLYGSRRTALTAFQVAAESPASEIAAGASLNVGITLNDLDRRGEALAVYDEVVRKYGDDPALREQAAAAMVNKGVTLTKLGRRPEAVATYEQVVVRFDESPEIGLREQVAKALVGKGVALGESSEFGLATAAFGQVLERFDTAEEPVLRTQVAAALVGMGHVLSSADMPAEAIETYNKVVSRFGEAPETGLRQLAAEALGNKGLALAAMGRLEDAMEAYEEVIWRYDDSNEEGLRRLTAGAHYSLGLTLTTLGREREAIRAFEQIASQYGGSSDPELGEIVERAAAGKTVASGTLKRSEEIRANDAEALEHANRSEAQRLQADFERNLREPVRGVELKLLGLDLFADTGWQLQRSMNLLLGRNGFGKSLLLRLVVGMLQRDQEATASLFRPEAANGQIELRLLRDERSEAIRRDRDLFPHSSLGKVPVLAIPDARFMDRSKTSVSDIGALNLATDGATHFLGQLPYQSTVDALLGGLALDYWEHETFDIPSFHLINDVLARLTGQSLEFNRIEREGRTGFRIWVHTEGLDRELEIQRASQGTLSVIAIFGLIHAFLQDLARIRGLDPTDEVRDIEAMVVIDEVDAHLHPVWQQKIRNTLVETFPNVQFLITAHSPLVVAGCGPGEVSVLRRTDDGYAVQQLVKDFVGASAQQLYEEIFEVEDVDETFSEYALMKDLGKEPERDRELEDLLQKEEREGLTTEEEDQMEKLLLETRRLASVETVRSRQRDAQVEEAERKAEIRRLETALEDAGGDVRSER